MKDRERERLNLIHNGHMLSFLNRYYQHNLQPFVGKWWH